MIYEFASDLEGDVHSHGPFTIRGVPGAVEAVSVLSDIVAIMFVDFDRGESDTDGHKVVLLNWKTEASVQVDPDLPLYLNRVGIQLYPHHYILYWQRDEIAFVKLHTMPNLRGPPTTFLPAVPPACHREHEALSTVRGWSWSLKLRVSPPFPNLHKTESNPPLISYILFPSITHPSPIEHYTLPITHNASSVPENGLEPLSKSKFAFSPPIKHSIPMSKARCSPRKLCVGPSGRRAVWLEQDFDSDELDLRLIRLAPNTSGCGFNTKELRPGTLPFLTSEIHCMAFDEVNTRLVLSLIQGDIWVLDFS